MKSITFNSSFKVGDKFLSSVEQTIIKAEPMYFNSSVGYAEKTGGLITKSFLRNLPLEFKKGVFDSRVHMLMPGWYPAIPGYHHDDVPRPNKIETGKHFLLAGQPNYVNPAYHAHHVMGLVNGGICPTEFLIGKITLPLPKKGELVYRKWHSILDKRVKQGKIEALLSPSLHYVFFDWQSFHQGTKATGNGWRWFGRVSINTDRVKTITNEIRKQSQVYLEFPMEGW